MATRTINSSAPGKVILHGEHAVVFGKNAIAVSVDLRTRVQLQLPTNTNQLVLSFQMLFKEAAWTLDELKTINFDIGDIKGDLLPYDEKYIKLCEPLLQKYAHDLCAQGRDSILAALFLYFGLSKLKSDGELLPMTINVQSDLAIGAGMGSSASFSVALTGALLKAFEPSPDASVNLELASKWAFESEKLFHGKPSGIDNNICTFGGAILYQGGAIRARQAPVKFLPILLVYTNVKRNTKLLVERTSGRRKDFPAIIEPMMNAIDQISLEEWQLITKEPNFERSKLLIEMNQNLLNCIGAGHDAIDSVITEAHRFNFASKLTGAGGGGTVFIALNENTCDELQALLIMGLEKKGFKCWKVTIGGEGLRVE